MPCYNTAAHKRLQRLLSRPCSYTTNAAKQHTGLYRGVSCDCSHSAANDTRPIQSTITPLAPRWSVSQRRSASSAYQIPPPRRTPYRSAQPHTMQARRSQLVPSLDRWQVLTRCQQSRPGSPADWSTSPPVQGQPGGGFDASCARRLAIWHHSPGGAVQQQEHGGRRGTIDG